MKRESTKTNEVVDDEIIHLKKRIKDYVREYYGATTMFDPRHDEQLDGMLDELASLGARAGLTAMKDGIVESVDELISGLDIG